MIEVKIKRFDSLSVSHQWELGDAISIPYIGDAKIAAKQFLDFCAEIGAPTHERYVLLNDDGMEKIPSCRFIFIHPDGTRFTIGADGKATEERECRDGNLLP